MPVADPKPSAKAAQNRALLAHHGLALPPPTLRALLKRGIRTESQLSLEYQKHTSRYLLRGTESGGAVADMGRYCAYLDASGQPIPWLQPIDSLGVNGRHAVVLAPELVRIDMLRIGRTYELAITRHTLRPTPGGPRPAIDSKLLFRGVHGTLALELWRPENADLRGGLAPAFYTSSGDARDVPEAFEPAIRVITGALACLGCRHSHIARPARPDYPAPA